MPAYYLRLACLVCACFFISSVAAAQEEQDPDEPRPGLVGHYTDANGGQAVRVDRNIAFAWGQRRPGARLSEGTFRVRWQGLLLSQTEGDYQFSAYAAGRVKVRLRGETLIDQQADRPSWMDSDKVRLPFGWHPVEIEFEKTSDDARVAMYWSGPKFQVEPISSRQWFHLPEHSPGDLFARGELLVRALRCAACHEIAGQKPLTKAPALDRLSGNLHREWVAKWLTDDAPHQNDAPHQGVRRMPSFGLSAQQAAAVADAIYHESAPAPKNPSPPSFKKSKKKNEPSPPTGEELFLTLGCLACHKMGEFGNEGLLTGGDLSEIAAKRPAGFFARWLDDPKSINRHHRMPVFKLSTYERFALAEYLASKGKGKGKIAKSPDERVALSGADSVVAFGCRACHHLPEKFNDAPPLKKTRLGSASSWDDSCLGDPAPAKHRPGYRVSQPEREAIQHYVSEAKRDDDAKVDGRWALAEHNCLACHARGASEGLAPTVKQVVSKHSSLAPVAPAMTAPPLISVGDKLHDQALLDAVTLKSGSRRPWLKIRMPKFALDDQERDAIVKHFVESDRIPPRSAKPAVEPITIAQRLAEAAGSRLVTSDGFGCTSCHAVGEVTPGKTPLNARGPDLAMLGERIRKTWYDRWVRNPARIVPRMEMPAVQIPVQGVLGGNLDRQLASVWRVLNEPGFRPPRPNPVRVVRRSGGDSTEPVALLTDVVRLDSPDGKKTHVFVKPLLIGLSNRHNVLIDLQSNRLASWWMGDVARQRTEGKTWYWEAAADPVNRQLDSTLDGSELSLLVGGEELAPMVPGQFPTELDQWRHVPGGVEFHHRLHFGKGESDSAAVQVKQTITGLESGGGFARRISVSRTPDGAKARLRVLGSATAGKAKISPRRIDLPNSPDGASIELASGDATFANDGSVTLSGDNEAVVELHYRCRRRPYPFIAPEAPPVALAPMELNVAPGFECVRLPLSDEVMPTAITWRPDGTLVFASLKGRVWEARDTDGDEIEDAMRPISDDLAAPYGLHANADSIDVANKYAVLRLFDDNGDGVCDRTVNVASGWGHTTDYHDWTIGLPRDEQGGYYISTACQQDNRSAAAAHLRGVVMRLRPRTPTDDDPRQFSIEVVSEGHRFPMGIARRRDGALFVTDNQGNYNPFNELNHVAPGRHFGFINKLQSKEDVTAPLTPPAINLPHPWTRSVNGICFLETPANLAAPRFGPFEGHLVGCEINTKRLIRMTLQKVGDTFQGAAYPLTPDPPQEGQALLGPLCGEVSPQGELYVGSVLDSGWGGGNNIGTLVRMRMEPDSLPAGIREVRAEREGLVVMFTRPVDVEKASDPSRYLLSSYTRVSTPIYGGDDKNRRVEKIAAVDVAPDGMQATIGLKSWREGYVYELRIESLVGEGEQFFPAEAHYTLNVAPK